MTERTFLQRLETLGYYTLPRAHPECPGFSGLLVVLRQTAHGHEPERIDVGLHEWNGKTTMMRLHADGNEPRSHVVSPGQLTIRSGQEQEATFYTFGGTLENEALAGETVFSLRSSAPVLELLPEGESLANLLAAETEVLIARAEAQQRLSSQEVLDRLARAGPEAMYQAVLQSLLPKDEEPVPAHLRHTGFFKMLERERQWYEQLERWPVFPKELETLLRAVDDG